MSKKPPLAVGMILWACSQDLLDDDDARSLRNKDGTPITIDQYLAPYAVAKLDNGELMAVSLLPYTPEGGAPHVSVTEIDDEMFATRKEAIGHAVKDIRKLIDDARQTIKWLESHL